MGQKVSQELNRSMEKKEKKSDKSASAAQPKDRLQGKLIESTCIKTKMFLFGTP